MSSVFDAELNLQRLHHLPGEGNRLRDYSNASGFNATGVFSACLIATFWLSRVFEEHDDLPSGFASKALTQSS
jgi:hypothetical protein